MGPTVRGDAGLPRSRRPTTPAGATSPGPAFLPERHRSPGYVVPPQPARAGYSGPGPSRVARHLALHPPPSPPLRRSRRPLLAGDLGRGGPRREGSPRLCLREQGPRDHQIPRPAHLPTSAAAPDVPPGWACYPTRPAPRLSARASHTRSPERPVRRRLLRDWRPE